MEKKLEEVKWDLTVSALFSSLSKIVLLEDNHFSNLKLFSEVAEGLVLLHENVLQVVHTDGRKKSRCLGFCNADRANAGDTDQRSVVSG